MRLDEVPEELLSVRQIGVNQPFLFEYLPDTHVGNILAIDVASHVHVNQILCLPLSNKTLNGRTPPCVQSFESTYGLVLDEVLQPSSAWSNLTICTIWTLIG